MFGGTARWDDRLRDHAVGRSFRPSTSSRAPNGNGGGHAASTGSSVAQPPREASAVHPSSSQYRYRKRLLGSRYHAGGAQYGSSPATPKCEIRDVQPRSSRNRNSWCLIGSRNHPTFASESVSEPPVG